MPTRNSPLRNGIRCLAIAIPLAACSPAPSSVKPENQQSSDQTSHSFFGRLFGSSESLQLPEAQMITRETACAPYLGTDRLTEEEHTVAIASGDLWQRMREGMTLDHSVSDARIEKEIAFYRKNHRLLKLIAERASIYMHFVVDELEQRDMPLEIALIPAMESAYNPTARSPGGAVGMWQFMPGTARVYGLSVSNNFDERRDVVESTRAAVDYLNRLHRKLGGDWLNAVTAYNTGELNVMATIKRNERQGKPTDFWHLGLRAPASHYAPRLIALAKIIAEPQRYGVSLPPIANTPAFASVKMDSRANLIQTANAAGISSHQLFLLNPGLNRNALPRGQYTVHVPYGKQTQFELAVASASRQNVASPRYAYNTAPSTTAQSTVQSNARQIYVVKNGDNLWRISRQFKVSANAIIKWNGLTSNNLKQGQKLTLQLEN